MHCAIAVIFEQIHPRSEVRVPIHEAAQFQTNHAGSHRILKVEWHDGNWSWGKLWYFGETNVVCRIGAGAYGDLTVWEHDISPYNRPALRAAGILPALKVA